MPPTPFSRAAGDNLEGHRDADQLLIETICAAIQDRMICDQEYAAIARATALVITTVVPLVGYMERQEQAFRMIQLISNTGGMTDWVDEQLRGMAMDRTMVPLEATHKKPGSPCALRLPGSGMAAHQHLDLVQ